MKYKTLTISYYRYFFSLILGVFKATYGSILKIGQEFDHTELNGLAYKTTKLYFQKSRFLLDLSPLLACICMFIMYEFNLNP